MTLDQHPQVSMDEVVQLGAVNHEFYCTTFFPRTVRQAFAPMHHDAWNKLSSDARLVNLIMFRGAGKTSHCRLYTSKMIAYGVSNTILYIGKSEGHAIRSTSWIKKQVEENTLWAEAFGLRPGSKWQDTEFEIIVGVGTPDEHSIWIMAAGILGSIRGINRDDFRPDLIVLDDVLDDENAHTPEQRQKVENLVYGALLESLAPKSEAPHAKMIGLNTPQNKEDFAVKALKDPTWLSAVYGCWTEETKNYPTQFQESAWAERFPSEELRKEKVSAGNRNMLSTFLREKECKLVSQETASFQVPWLRKYVSAPQTLICAYAIDPVPPPSEVQLAKGLKDKDFEAHVVWGARGRDRFLMEYRLMRGHNPTWTIKTFFELQMKYRPLWTRIEGVAYQRTLEWILKKAMEEKRVWYPIKAVTDKRNKFHRIVSAHTGPASSGRLYIRDDQPEFLEQFAQYPEVSNDDLLDASASALDELESFNVDEDGHLLHVTEMEEELKPLRIRRAP